MKLLHGDCLDLMKDIPDNSIDMILCDPPYFKIVKDRWDNIWKIKEEYLNFIRQLAFEWNRILKKDSNLFIFTSRQLNKEINFILDCHFNEQRNIIWCRKRNIETTRGKSLSSGYEPISFYSKGKIKFNSIKIKSNNKRKEYTEGFLKEGVSLSDCWLDIPALPHNSKEKVNHPTQKPISLMERILLLGSNVGDSVLDCFMGSGSTGVACVNTNRDFIGIELDEKYFEIAKKRIEEAQENKKFFGVKP